MELPLETIQELECWKRRRFDFISIKLHKRGMVVEQIPGMESDQDPPSGQFHSIFIDSPLGYRIFLGEIIFQVQNF